MSHQIDRRICSLPNNLCKEILRTENLITHCFKILDFIIVHRNEYHTIITEQITGNFQSRIYHIEPIGVKATVGFCVALHGVIVHLVAHGVKCTIGLFKLFSSPTEIVVIHKIVTCIVGRVNVNHLHAAEICFAKYFEHVEIVALNIEIFSCIEVNRFFATRAQRKFYALVGKTRGSSLVGPGELVALLALGKHLVRQFSTELVEVDGKLRPSVLAQTLGDALREQCGNLRHIAPHHITALHS